MDEQNPYRGPDAEVAEFSSGDELAGRGARLGAAIIDAIILMVILGPLTYMGGYWQAAMEAGQAGGQLPLGTTLKLAVIRSQERPVGNGGVRTCRARGRPFT